MARKNQHTSHTHLFSFPFRETGKLLLVALAMVPLQVLAKGETTEKQILCSPVSEEQTPDKQIARKNYAWRGVMIDVSRHFMPIDFLQRQIQAMSHFGLNTLHLHLTDAAGWRLEMKSHPRLTQLAAWRTSASWKKWWNDGHRHYAEEHSDSAFGGYYTQEEMKRLVHYADSLGVTIVPEIEFPAHSEEVTAAYPELGCTGQPYQCADFCLGNEKTYRFIGEILDELLPIFSSPYIHMGGDEAGGAHWMECPKCKAKMKELDISSRQQLQQYAMQRVAQMVNQRGRKMVAWDEILPPTEADTTIVKPIIMVWRNVETAQQAIRQGHDVILCPGRWYYLDAYQDAPIHEPEAMGGYTPLRTVWQGAPLPKETSEERENTGKLLGEQVNLWTEYVPNERHAERMLWPRALALTTHPHDEETTEEAYEKFREQVLSEALPWLREHNIQPFPLEQEVGQRPAYKKPIHCLSTGKPVQYISPYYSGYAAGGDGALTDGLRGGWSNTDGRWQGFISRGRLDAIIDLGKEHTIHKVEADFMQSLGPEIYLPETFLVSVSNNGEHFVNIHCQTPERSPETMDYKTFSWTGEAHARYVRIQAGAGNRGGWVFTDEIIIE